MRGTDYKLRPPMEIGRKEADQHSVSEPGLGWKLPHRRIDRKSDLSSGWKLRLEMDKGGKRQRA